MLGSKYFISKNLGKYLTGEEIEDLYLINNEEIDQEQFLTAWEEQNVLIDNYINDFGYYLYNKKELDLSHEEILDNFAEEFSFFIIINEETKKGNRIEVLTEGSGYCYIHKDNNKFYFAGEGATWQPKEYDGIEELFSEESYDFLEVV